MIVDIWRHQAGEYFCVSTKTRGDVWHDEFFARRELDEVADYVRDHHDCNVYFCPHGLSVRRRKRTYAVMPTMLWADMDGADPRELRLPPTIALESSPGRYVGLWLTDNVVTEQLNKRLAYSIGADKSGWDLTQVLRMPGTINYKYASRPRVQLLWDNGFKYRVSELENELPQIERRERRADTREPDTTIERRLRWHSARQYMQPAVQGDAPP
jgi:hypothetical protein